MIENPAPGAGRRLLGYAPAVGHLEAYHLKPESADTALHQDTAIGSEARRSQIDELFPPPLPLGEGRGEGGGALLWVAGVAPP